MTLQQEMKSLARNAREAAHKLVILSAEQKKQILSSMASAIDVTRKEIKVANDKDIQAGEKAGLSAALLDRLRLTDKRIDEMVQGIREIAELPDPVGSIIEAWDRPNGLKLERVRVPLGVIAFIYESRPNVTSDAAALCVKSSNAIILRGGKEAIYSNQIIAKVLQEGGRKAGLPEHSVQLVQTTDRDAVKELVQLEGQIDLVIPRGGESLIRAVTEQARVPVLKHFEGICHVYVHEDADLEMALKIADNAKCQRPSVCNAMETLLVSEKVADEFLPKVAELLKSRGVELRGDEKTRSIVSDVKLATEKDWRTEYLELILSIRVVDGIDQAISHINTYGSKHTDAIVSRSKVAQDKFLREVDSGTVLANASTRFADGGEFGLGAEIGISTDKLHARGPMGVKDLTTYKYLVRGSGQVRG